jgi:alpha-beta hydrolase superfamily lysophospholipase
MQIEHHAVGEIFVRHFKTAKPRYALLISHGIGAHSGIYNKFGAYQAERGVDVWAYDAPGHGLSTNGRPRGQFDFAEWVDACVATAKHVKAETGLNVISVGSSLGVAAAYSALHADELSGAVLMGSAVVPGGPSMPKAHPFRSPEVIKAAKLFGRALRFDIMRAIDFEKDYGFPGAADQRRFDSLNLESYEFSSLVSMFNYDPVIAPGENTKPILYTYGADDQMTPVAEVEKAAQAIAGPVRFELIPRGKHQLMLFNTEVFSDLVEDWVAPILKR